MSKRTPDFSNARVGDKVYDSLKGNGVIESIESEGVYAITVRFLDNDYKTYTVKGLHDAAEDIPNLFYGQDILDNLPNSCFEPPERLPELEVDAKVWVRFDKSKDEKWVSKHFSHWEGDQMACFHAGYSSHTVANDSELPPRQAVGLWSIWSLTDPNER